MVKWFMFFTVLLTITYLISPKIVNGRLFEKIGEIGTFGQFKNEIGFCLMFFIGYYISRFTRPGKDTFFIVAIILTLINIGIYTYTVHSLALLFGKDENTINTAYNFVALLPIYVFAFKHHPKGVIGLLLVSTFYVMLGAKRGAIVCLLSSVLIAFYWYSKNSNGLLKKIFAFFIVTTLLCLAGYWCINNMYLMERLEYMESSGIGMREVGYPVMLNHWLYDNNVFYQMFGNGTAQTVNIWGNYGHNDWLELLIDNGVFGVIVYICLFVYSIRFAIKHIHNTDTKLAAFLCIVIWALKTVFSMGYTDLYSGIITFMLGYCIQNAVLQNKTHLLIIKTKCNEDYTVD